MKTFSDVNGKVRVSTTKDWWLFLFYERKKNQRRNGLLMLESEDYAVIVESNDDGDWFEVSASAGSAVTSYVEVRVDAAHPLYERIKIAVATLNMTEIENTVTSVGTRHGQETYLLYVNEAEHKLILNSTSS